MTEAIMLTPERLVELRTLLCVAPVAPRPPKSMLVPMRTEKRAAIESLLGTGRVDKDIAAACGVGKNYVGTIRRAVGLPTEPRWLKRDVMVSWLLAWPEMMDGELAARSGIGDRSSWSLVRREMGITSAKRQRDDARRVKIIRLHRSGLSYRAIGARMGVSKITIGGILRRWKQQEQ